MSTPEEEIDRVATGTLVQVEMWQRLLRESGIQSQVVGNDLSASFGTALTGSIELWVRRADLGRAREILEEAVEREDAGQS